MISEYKITVVIPTCDRPAEFLREAVLSVLHQSLAPDEVIIVDNGVSDADVGDLLENTVIKLLRLPPRVGPSRARNFGAAMAQSQYIAFLDDDDWWDEHFLREAMSALRIENARCVYGRKDVSRHGNVEPYKCAQASTLTIPVLLRRNPGTGGQNLVIEKMLFWYIGGFNESLKTSEDKAIAIEVLLSGNVIAIAPDAAAIMRPHGGARARQAYSHKLLFVWKYRHLLGVKGTAFEMARVLRYLARQHVRSLLGQK